MEQEKIYVIAGESIVAEDYDNNYKNQPFNSIDQPVHNINDRHSLKNSCAVSTFGDLGSEQTYSEGQVTGLERQLLLHNCAATASNKPMSNNKKVSLCAVSVIIPGLGQIIGIITGSVMLAEAMDSDRRSYGAALLAVSVIVLLIELVLGFLGKSFLDGLY